MIKISYFLYLAIITSCTTSQESQHSQNTCDWCGAAEAPSDVTWQTTIANQNEAGTRIQIEGTVFESDGKTPAQGVILYLYHTNIEGVYPKRGNETGNGIRHGYLRGWIKTAKDGKYSFNTIKPEPYPGRTVPAHIHITVKQKNIDEYWIKDYFFKGDELLSSRDKKNETKEERFNHVIRLTGSGDTLYGKRDILLKN